MIAFKKWWKNSAPLWFKIVLTLVGVSLALAYGAFLLFASLGGMAEFHRFPKPWNIIAWVMTIAPIVVAISVPWVVGVIRDHKGQRS